MAELKPYSQSKKRMAFIIDTAKMLLDGWADECIDGVFPVTHEQASTIIQFTLYKLWEIRKTSPNFHWYMSDYDKNEEIDKILFMLSQLHCLRKKNKYKTLRPVGEKTTIQGTE